MTEDSLALTAHRVTLNVLMAPVSFILRIFCDSLWIDIAMQTRDNPPSHLYRHPEADSRSNIPVKGDCHTYLFQVETPLLADFRI